MSFDKDYPNRHDRRAPYYHTGIHDPACRPGGGCPWCTNSRTRYRHAKRVHPVDFEEIPMTYSPIPNLDDVR